MELYVNEWQVAWKHNIHRLARTSEILQFLRLHSSLCYPQTPSAGITHFYHIVMVWVKLAQKPFKQVGMFHFSYCQHKKSFMLCHRLPSSTNVQKYHCHSGQKNATPSLEEGNGLGSCHYKNECMYVCFRLTELYSFVQTSSLQQKFTV